LLCNYLLIIDLKKMNKNQINQAGQNADGMSNQPAPVKNNEFPEKNPAVNDPSKNDPTRKDKPPFIISKL
jgi:hypothetical protein